MLEQDRANRERLSTRDFDKNFLVSAGAGAGKTYLTVQRAFNMLCDKELGILPQDIVLITFTRKAATEMKTRLNRWIRDALAKAEDPEQVVFLQGLLNSLPEMQISTIHSFCQRVLNDYPLESGVGFAPHFDSEDGGPDSRSTVYFNEAWMSGKCPETMSAGISQKTALAAFNTLSSRLTVQPQYIDPDTEEGRAFAEETIQMCRNLVDQFRNATDGADPGLFHYTIENALRSGENPPLGAVLAAAKKIASQGEKVRDWMGKSSRKTADKACEALGKYLAWGNPDTDDALAAIEKMFEAARKVKASNRHSFIAEMISGLPAGHRAVAQVAESLPEDEDLKKLTGNIDTLLHGIITKETLSLCREYTEYRRKNHIISLDDMLNLTAELVRSHPDVREKLHERYKTFFVDEYQDTDPIQTDILFAITADKYDPDWHKCVPRPGSLFLVGDAKQGIYRFRGADISLWQEAEEAMKATGGEVAYLYKNFRSTTEICDAVTDIFGESGSLPMEKGPYQAAYNGMVAHRGHGPEAIFHHTITCDNENDGHQIAAEQIAQFIQDRVESGQNKYEDFLLLSFYKERDIAYANELRVRHIPVKFDGALPINAYPPIQLLNMRVQAVCHPFDETLSFRVLCVCGNVQAEEWDLFRMNVKQLPEETKLVRYRDTRSLMGHVDELAELLPDTEMNRRILKALAMLDRDRRLSQQRTPCAFLEELVERSDGLFIESYDAEDFQNQYAALLQTIDSIRAMNPQQFVDMADMLKTSAESEMDRMPSIRADTNFVRLMNLHKAKGLQGKIVVFLPKKVSAPKADSNIQRDGMNTLGWFQITDGDSFSAPKYSPPDWDEHMKEEVEFLKAERIRLEYVALTRAEDEAHIFTIRTEQKSKGPGKAEAWKGFDAVGTVAPAITVSEVEAVEADETPELAREARAVWQSLRDRLPEVNSVGTKRLSPSDVDKKRLQNEPITVEEQGNDYVPETKPGGTKWGSLVHRTAELVVMGNVFTATEIDKAAKQAVIELFPSELINERDRNALLIPKEAVTLDQIHEYLMGRVGKSLAFMSDRDSSFRKMLETATCYPELPFMISITKDDTELFSQLMPLADLKDESTIELSGKIDLALRYPNGHWRILDYKTDRMLPCDHGDKQVFYSRLEHEYGTQLEIYRIVLERLTGEPVKEAKLLSV